MKKSGKMIRKMALPMLFALSNMAYAQEQEEASIFEMSLEELLNMEVTSVSKKVERLQDVASSIYVLTADDIAKSGATTLHEALRNVPGYWGVQDEYSSVYASVRNAPTANAFPGTVLYLLDGTPIQEQMESTFSFQNFDIPLDEIDRIEVITGSGGTVYGANSATGVVNIFTKNPEDYDGINVRAEGAAPGYALGSVRAGGKAGEKLSLSAYGKFRYFSGWDSMAGIDEDGNQTVPNSVFAQDYDKSTYFSAGGKLNFAFSDKSKLSARLHFNARNKYAYTSTYSTDFVFTRDDHTQENEVNANRLVGNIRYDYQVNDNHSFFVRVSSNSENDFYRSGGGMNVSNSILDFEFQDNVSLGSFNDLSFGLNYRLVNFDVHDINDPTYVNYIEPDASESINGAFVQDKIKLLDEKLNFILGVKAERYSLVNDKYYLSPMAKVSFIASENITLWGGFTQSYTTPGFNNTNVDFFIFQSPTAAEWVPVVEQGVYDQAYQTFIDLGTQPELAATLAEGYVNSDEGQQIVADQVAQLQNDVPNIAAKNGSHTVPTQFRSFEFGVKTNFNGKLQANVTFFHTDIKDGIAVNPGNAILPNQESQAQPGRFADYYLYGNYVKGNSLGAEVQLKWLPIEGLLLEASHTWLTTSWEYQENEDFDLDGINTDATSTVPFIPEHVFRLRANYDFGTGFNVNAQFIQTSEIRTEARYYYDTERYQNLVETDVFGNSDGSTIVAANNSRTIVNLRVEKRLMGDQISIYLFGNDVTNSGNIADTDDLKNKTLSRIGAMYGLGANFKF